MASVNPFDLLGDDDNDDPSHLVAVQQQKIAAMKTVAEAKPPAKLPTKPLPPAQAVREARSNAVPARGGGRYGTGGGGRGRGGRGGFGQNRDSEKDNVNGFSGGDGFGGAGEERDAGKSFEKERSSFAGSRQPFRGGRRGGNANGEVHEDSERPPRRVFERRSGTGRGNEIKREGSGRGNWGTPNDDVIAQESEDVAMPEESTFSSQKQLEQEIPSSVTNKDDKKGEENVNEEKEEDKEMTLEEYEKIREEKRKALLAMKAKERKVEVDKELESMQQLSIKKGNDDIFVKLGSEKDSKKSKDNFDRDERAKKPVSINEFLKPAEGERYYSPGGRGRGRGRGDRGPYRGGGGSVGNRAPESIKIEDPGQFPTLGGK